MAKNGTKTILTIISLILTVAVVGAGVVVYAVTNTHETGDTAENLDKLESSGCKPSRTNTIEVAVIKTEITAIKDDVREMRVEQRADTKAILKAIEDKP